MKKILVVEDEPLLRNAYEIMLKAKGYETTTAENGQDALDLINGGLVPDLILLDMLMPRMDGREFLHASQIGIKHPDTKIILFSNLSNSNREREMNDLGVAERVLKSKVGPSELYVLIDKHLSSSKRGSVN